MSAAVEYVDICQDYGTRMRRAADAGRGLDRASHVRAEACWRAGGAGGSSSDHPRLAALKPARLQQIRAKRGRRRIGAEASYSVSADGNWALESFFFPADMCGLWERAVFNLWNQRQLPEAAMGVWQTLDPPVQPPRAVPAAWGGKCEVAPDVDPSAPQVASRDSPGLSLNVGCHDEYPDEEPEPDYNSGCASVTFATCTLEEPRGLYTKVQVLRAKRFANTWDNVGRSWVCVLPPSPLEPVVRRGLAPLLPLGVLQRVWEFADSWPGAEL